MPDAILVENLGKRFNRYHAEKPVTLMEAALSGLRRVKPIEHFWALRGVSFTVSAGEMLGVIGHNGAGKSTLLQLLGEVAHPDEGRIKLRGRIGALLDLGAGFHGDLTGRENVFVTAVVSGLSRREVEQRFDAIVAFAELEQFIDNPVRTYSSGMMMRLAFSVAVHTDPEILLVDEYLSVGDLSFQTKCLDRISAMKEQGCAIVFVSHDVGQVERLCDRALWLQQGNVVAYGSPDLVAGKYVSHMRSQTHQRTPSTADAANFSTNGLTLHENRFGSLEVEITQVRLTPASNVKAGEALKVEIDYHNAQRMAAAIFSVSISQAQGRKCLDVNTQDTGMGAVLLRDRGTLRLILDRVDLATGDYFVDVGIYEPNWNHAYDYHWQAYPLMLYAPDVSTGILAPPLRWEVVSKPCKSEVRA